MYVSVNALLPGSGWYVRGVPKVDRKEQFATKPKSQTVVFNALSMNTEEGEHWEPIVLS